MARELIDIAVSVHIETERAFLVSDTGVQRDAVWLPKSQIEIERKGNTAIDKGLV